MTIEKPGINDLNTIFNIFTSCRTALEKEGIFQWTEHYPTVETVRGDIESDSFYCLKNDHDIVGVINLATLQEEEYDTITWQYPDETCMVIHRLAIHPDFQGQGAAGKLMNFAEDWGVNNKYTSVRLDAYSGNERALMFYENRGYEKRGEVSFPNRKLPFFCYEKQL
jgi:GNAT superfamily N-acetyltransferase